MSAGCEALVAELAAEAERVVRGVVPFGSRCALVGFPNHDNAGDSAIWMGERTVLERLGAEIVHACDARTYVPEALDATLGGGMIVIHGGGNLGDVWPRQQQLRERVLADFPGVPVVQLPQSIHFADPAAAAAFQTAARAHGDVVLLARERQSLGRAEALCDRALSCPDLAFVLGPQNVPEPPSAAVLWLGRTDKEAVHAPPADEEDVVVVDWIRPFAGEPPWPKGALDALETVKALTTRIEEDPASARELSRPLIDAFDIAAAQRVARGLRILARGEVVVSDRLHAHVFSLLLGRPHVLLDQSYGKTRSVYETWTKPCALASWADTADEALATARRLVSRRASR
jgi:pyruvyl transferase EpsO